MIAITNAISNTCGDLNKLRWPKQAAVALTSCGVMDRNRYPKKAAERRCDAIEQLMRLSLIGYEQAGAAYST